MKTVWGIAGIILLASLLTWLSMRAVNSDAEIFDRALSELDQLGNVQAALRRDILAARAGLLQDYDPLVEETNAINASVGRLRGIATIEPQLLAVVDQLTELIEHQEQTVEQFKSDNALLHNSLTHFARIGRGLEASDQAGAITPQVSALVAGMLHLTLNTSPAAVEEVRGRLDVVAAAASNDPHSADSERVQPLLAHGWLLLGLLPQTDGELKTLTAGADAQSRDALRAIILKRQLVSRTTARHYRTILYVTSLLLVGVLIYLALQLRARAQAVHRLVALEHAIACISTRFISAASRDTDAGIEQALAGLAECVGSDRAYFLVRGDQPRTYLWCRPGVGVLPGWPEHAPDLGVQFAPAEDRIVQVVDARRLRSRDLKQACLALGLRGWMLASGRSSQGSVFLGFDAVTHRCRMHPCELGVIPMALNSFVNAIERQTTESEKSLLQERVQQVRRMETVGALASGVAHNFNNIIGAILGYVEMADAQIAPGSRGARHLGEIRRAGERGRDVVDQILRFGRRRSGRRQPIHVRSLLAESESLLRASLPSDVELVVGDIPDAAIVQAEPAQLQQVILNLCSNAAQAMDGRGRVEVETALREIVKTREATHGTLAPGRHVVIAVIDRGCGIDQSTLQNLFEPFFTTRPTGNGLGLATACEIIREHGGAIDVISNPGEGSRFEVWMACISTRTTDREDSAAGFGRGETVLLIGQTREQMLRDEEILAALGYEPVGFLRDEDATAACRLTPERFDAILIGHALPTAEAIRLPAALHAIAPRLPILVAADPAEALDVDALVGAGVSDIVVRPIVADEIAAALTRRLGRAGPGATTATTATTAIHSTEVEISA
jgi:signal transduction histidine kinase